MISLRINPIKKPQHAGAVVTPRSTRRQTDDLLRDIGRALPAHKLLHDILHQHLLVGDVGHAVGAAQQHVAAVAVELYPPEMRLVGEKVAAGFGGGGAGSSAFGGAVDVERVDRVFVLQVAQGAGHVQRAWIEISQYPFNSCRILPLTNPRSPAGVVDSSSSFFDTTFFRDRARFVCLCQTFLHDQSVSHFLIR